MDIVSVEDSTVKFKLDKNTLTVSSDPIHHGFWQLNLERGPLPDKFRGKYTKKALAISAANFYIESRKKD